MTTNDKFAVVEFIDEGAIEVVPLRWVNCKDHTCPFPEGPKAGSLRRNSRSCPLDSWPSYRIKVRCIKNSFKKADLSAEKLQFTSAIESDDESEDETDNRRRRRARVLFSPSSVKAKRAKETSHPIPVEEALATSPKTPITLKPVYENPSQQEVAEDVNSDESANYHAHSSSDVCSDSDDGGATAGSSLTTPSRPASHRSSSNFSTRSDLNPFAGESSLTFQTFASRVFSQLHDIKEDLAVIKSNTFKSTGKKTECPITIPITSEEAVRENEERLEAKNIQRAFEKWAAQLGGIDYKSHCRRILKSLISHGLSRRMNFTGRNQKLGFEKLKLCTILISAVLQAHDVDRSSVEKIIQDWFRNSGDHDGGRDKRRNRNHL